MTLAERLEAARIAAGAPSFYDVRDQIRDRLGDYAPSHETVRLMHTRMDGRAAKKPDPILIGVLADIYGVEVADLSPETAAMWARIEPSVHGWAVAERKRMRVVRSRCSSSAARRVRPTVDLAVPA